MEQSLQPYFVSKHKKITKRTINKSSKLYIVYHSCFGIRVKIREQHGAGHTNLDVRPWSLAERSIVVQV